MMFRLDTKTTENTWRFGSIHHINTPLSAMIEAAEKIYQVIERDVRVVCVDRSDQTPDETQIVWESETCPVTA